MSQKMDSLGRNLLYESVQASCYLGKIHTGAGIAERPWSIAKAIEPVSEEAQFHPVHPETMDKYDSCFFILQFPAFRIQCQNQSFFSHFQRQCPHFSRRGYCVSPLFHLC